MKIDFKKIINIKNKKNLNDFVLNKPIFQKNYLFHYLIELNNLNGLKLKKWPVYIENNDGLNGFHIAARLEEINILEYLIETYPEYIYNRNINKDAFTYYLQVNQFAHLIKKYPNLNWDNLIINGTDKLNGIFKSIILNLKFKELIKFLDVYKIKPSDKVLRKCLKHLKFWNNCAKFDLMFACHPTVEAHKRLAESLKQTIYSWLNVDFKS